jgi:hypothetical protein
LGLGTVGRPGQPRPLAAHAGPVLRLHEPPKQSSMPSACHKVAPRRVPLEIPRQNALEGQPGLTTPLPPSPGSVEASQTPSWDLGRPAHRASPVCGAGPPESVCLRPDALTVTRRPVCRTLYAADYPQPRPLARPYSDYGRFKSFAPQHLSCREQFWVPKAPLLRGGTRAGRRRLLARLYDKVLRRVAGSAEAGAFAYAGTFTTTVLARRIQPDQAEPGPTATPAAQRLDP